MPRANLSPVNTDLARRAVQDQLLHVECQVLIGGCINIFLHMHEYGLLADFGTANNN